MFQRSGGINPNNTCNPFKVIHTFPMSLMSFNLYAIPRPHVLISGFCWGARPTTKMMIKLNQTPTLTCSVVHAHRTGTPVSPSTTTRAGIFSPMENTHDSGFQTHTCGSTCIHANTFLRRNASFHSQTKIRQFAKTESNTEVAHHFQKKFDV